MKPAWHVLLLARDDQQGVQSTASSIVQLHLL
jgi:hypothetical protein